MRAAIAVLVMALIGCRSSGGDDKARPAPDPSPQPDAIVTPAPPEPTLKEHMQGHFTAIRDIERALVAGDLDTARDRAKWLAEHRPPDATAGWEPHLEAVKKAATALTSASDMASATDLAAALGTECASCHVTTTAITSFPHVELPDADGGNKSAMLRHQWAADRLWEGLIGPSQSSWVQGAEVLSGAPFVPQVSLAAPEKKTVEAFAQQVHDLGREAVAAEADARASLYARLLRTCSGCHAIARKRPAAP